MVISEKTSSLNPWYLIDPKEEASRNAKWNVAFKTAAVIALIAATALVSSIVIFSFLTAGGTAIPSGLSITVAFAAMAGAPVTQGAVALWNKSKEYLAKEKKEQRTEEWRVFLSKAYLENGETLKIKKINQDKLFQHFGISANLERLNLIEQELSKSQIELKAGQAWIRLVARFMHELEITQKPDPEPLDLEALKDSSENLTESYQKRGEFYQREYTYRQMYIFPHVLNTVLLLAIIQQPFLEAVRLTDLGSLHIKPYIARQEDLIRARQDPYFCSNKENTKPIRFYKGPLPSVASELISVSAADPEIKSTPIFQNKLQRLTNLLLGSVPQIILDH